MFQFPWSASHCLYIQQFGTWLLHHVGFPIRTSPDQCSLTAPRGISSFATSFFGSWHLGILRALFLTYPHLLAFLTSLAIQFSKNNSLGGPKRDRTADLLLARQALSQLSYGPL
jgi:hypothetical protein